MSYPKILYIEIDEEITSIVDRVKRCRQKKIHLSIPRKSAIFQSLINLQILNRKAQDLTKKIIIVTNDKIGAKLSLKTGFETIKKIKITAKDTKNNNKNIHPIKAKNNLNNSEKPFIRKSKKSNLKEILTINKKKKKNRLKNEINHSNLLRQKPSHKSILLFIVISISLFAFIIYIALPGCNIYIRPRSEVIEQPVNVTLSQIEPNNNYTRTDSKHVILAHPIETVFERTIVFNTISEDFFGKNAIGKIVIINSSKKEWPLKDKTQFESPDGIIFRTQDWITVPPKINDKNGTIEVEVIADTYDTQNKQVGERGNIKPSKFTIRKLSSYNQQIIWGESKTNMTGGTSIFKKVIKEEDIEIAKKEVETELKSIAIEYLNNYLNDTNNLQKTNLVILNDNNYIKKEILEIRVPENIIGQEKDKFEVFAKIHIESLAFDNKLFVDMLKRELKSRVHPDMKLREDLISTDSIEYKVIDENKSLKQLKLSVTIKGIQEYIIEPTSESGERFVNKIKNEIKGMSILGAEKYISNLPKVAEVEISVWPFWASKIPNVSENINIKLKK